MFVQHFSQGTARVRMYPQGIIETKHLACHHLSIIIYDGLTSTFFALFFNETNPPLLFSNEHIA